MEPSTLQQQNPPPNERIHVLQNSIGHHPQITLTPSPSILATDTPQRTWNTTQCRQWIAALVMLRTDKKEDEAKYWASRFWGDGVDMFIYGALRWEGILCSRQLGFVIWEVIEGAKEREG